MRVNMKYKTHSVRPTMMGNDINGAFNCVNHDQLNHILQHYKFPEHLVNTSKDFNTNRSLHLAFEGKEGDPVPFSSEVPQGSPIPPVRFVIYAAALNAPQPAPPHRETTSYIEDMVMLQESPTQKEASRILQKRLDQRIE